MLIDYHLHNHFSPDSDADTRDILKQIKSRGIQEICFTNHAEWFDKNSANHTGTFDEEEAVRRFESIQWEMEHIRPEFEDISIKLGAEITYSTKDLSGLERLMNRIPFDFILGSVHNIDGFIINYHKSAHGYFEGKSEEETYIPYFNQLEELVDWGHCEVIAHFDVIKKYGHEYYGPFDPEKYKKQILKLLEKMKQKNMGIELNTGSLNVRCKELFPHPLILEWALKTGIENFTLSSDAHTVEKAGEFIAEALKIAKKAGLRTISTYARRSPELHKI